jgi:hypothetical protein
MAKSAKTASQSKMSKDLTTKDEVTSKPTAATKTKDAVSDHIPPLPLVITVMACSGFLFVYAFRDIFATGRNIGGDPDEAYLVSLFSMSWIISLYVIPFLCSEIVQFAYSLTHPFRRNFSNRRLQTHSLSLTTKKAGSRNRAD